MQNGDFRNGTADTPGDVAGAYGFYRSWARVLGAAALSFALFAVPAVASTPPSVIIDLPPVTEVADGAEPSGDEAAAVQTAEKEDPLAPVVRDEFDLLILEMRLNDLILSDGIISYITGSSIVLPLRDLATVLDFSISVDPAAGTANGWFIRENKLFSLNIARGELIIEGKVQMFDPALVEIHEEDIFVDIRLLSRWFPIDIEFDLSNLLVELVSREPLPIEEKIAREEYREKILSRKAQDDGSSLPFVEIPFKPVGVPMVDIDTQFKMDKDSDSPAKTTATYSAVMTGDLLYSNAEIFVAGENKEKVEELRLSLTRKDPDGDALGDLPFDWSITEAVAGDVYSPQLAGISRATLGRGFMISNAPLDAPNEFDRITLNGDLALGWDVELYRNEVLIGFSSGEENNTYEFEDVPLVFGVNVLRLIFYGPQGQQREEIRQFRIGPDQISPGEVQFRFAANQHDRPFLLRDDDADENLEGHRRLFWEAKTGVSRNVSMGANFVEIPDSENDSQRYATLSTSAVLGDVYGRLDLVKQFNEGWSAGMNAQTNVLGLSLIGEHAFYRNFFSEQVSDSDDPQSTSTSLRLDGAVPETFLPRIPFSLTGKHDRQKSGDSTSTLSNRLSAAVGPASVSNTLSYSRTSTDGQSSSSMSGSFLLGGRIDAFRVRGAVSYAVLPKKSIESTSLTGDWAITKEYRGELGVEHDLSNEEPETIFTAGFSAGWGVADVGFNLEYSDKDEVESTMTVSFGLGHDTATGKTAIVGRDIAESGGASAHVFLDINADGVFNEGDEPLEGVKFVADRGQITEATDENGHVLITGLESYKTVALRVDRGTLEDPFWVAEPDGYRMVPRPGSLAEVAFPVVSTGEIDGTVFRTWADETGEAAGVLVQLVDDKDEVIRELRTAYDGFFLFDFVRPGTYTLRVDPAQMAELGLITAREYIIEIDGGGTIASGKDFLLIKNPDEDAAKAFSS